MGLVFFAFLSQNPIFIGLAVAVYVVLLILFRKNKDSIYDYLERQAAKNNPEPIAEAV
ncbi:hypothetical protein D3C73_1270510 [compost metagenome]